MSSLLTVSSASRSLTVYGKTMDLKGEMKSAGGGVGGLWQERVCGVCCLYPSTSTKLRTDKKRIINWINLSSTCASAKTTRSTEPFEATGLLHTRPLYCRSHVTLMQVHERDISVGVYLTSFLFSSAHIF